MGRAKGQYNTINFKKVEKLKQLYIEYAKVKCRTSDPYHRLEFKGGLDAFDLVLETDDSIRTYEKELGYHKESDY